jgi:type I restriction enzyme, S subunit
MAISLEDLPLPAELPAIPKGWRYEALGDLVEERGISYGIVQPGIQTAVGIPIVRVNNIRNSRIDTSDMLMVESTIEAKFQRSRLRGGEVLLTLVGTLGEVAIVPDNLRGWNVARAVGVIPVRKDPGSLWVSICLRSAFIQHCIRTWATTTVQATFNLRDLVKLPIPIPPTDTREAIASVLGTLDDLIELNRDTNEILEEMARALFKSWFVDFDPVRAKLEGRPPAGMDAATAKLFPDHFQDSELGQIPKGWELGALSDNIELLSGGTPKTSEPDYWNGHIPWYSVKDAPSDADVWVVDTEKKVTSLGISNSAAKILPERTTIISARGTVGKLALTGCPMAMNQSCYGVRGAGGYGEFFTYYALKEAVEELQQNAHGSVFDTITRDTFTSLRVASPPPSIAKAFDGIVEPLLETILANVRESRDLASLRDTLLPKLLSGEVKAPAAKEVAR